MLEQTAGGGILIGLPRAETVDADAIKTVVNPE